MSPGLCLHHANSLCRFLLMTSNASDHMRPSFPPVPASISCIGDMPSATRLGKCGRAAPWPTATIAAVWFPAAGWSLFFYDVQCVGIAYSRDDHRTWTKYAHNPVVPIGIVVAGTIGEIRARCSTRRSHPRHEHALYRMRLSGRPDLRTQHSSRDGHVQLQRRRVAAANGCP